MLSNAMAILALLCKHRCLAMQIWHSTVKKNNIPLYSLISDPPAWTVFDTINIISFIVDRAAGCSVVSSAF